MTMLVCEITDSLDLSGNRLTGSIPTEIAQIPLYALALNHNELTGTFPTELALLSNIGTQGCVRCYVFGMHHKLTMPSVCEITDFLWLDGNSITGSLESFCSAFINGTDDDNPYFDYISIAADCLEDTVNCSCCTKCCDEDNYCREEIAR